MPWSLTRGQTVAIVLLVAALLTDAVLTLHNIREVATSVQWVSHTHEVLGQLEQVVSTLKDAETGQRGYLLTGERPYLDPYEQAVARIRGQLDRLRDLTIDNPPQTAHALKLEQLTAERLAVLRRGIDRFQAEPDKTRALTLSRQYLLQGEGKRLMDLIRDEIYGMQQLERALLARRDAASRANTRTALATTIVGLGLGLVLVTMVIALVARNLAARQRAADVLHAERERFRTTLTSIGDAVVVTDAQGRITLLNPVAQALTGWGGEALGQPLDTVFRIVNEATRETVENPVRQVIRLGTIVGLANHTVLIAKDGSRELPIDDSGAPIRDTRGRIVGVVLVFRDITERRGTERALEDADRRKDEFLAMLAHELRNPLAPIRNAAHTLALLGTGDDRVRWVSGVIERQVGLMTRLVDDLLDVSRITSGKITLQRATVSVREVLAQAVEAARPPAESRGQALEVDVPEDAGWVDGDPARLAQAVGNLLDNAIKYTDDGGRVRLRARSEADEVVIVVEDSGRGHRSRAPAARLRSLHPGRPLARAQAGRARPRPDPRAPAGGDARGARGGGERRAGARQRLHDSPATRGRGGHRACGGGGAGGGERPGGPGPSHPGRGRPPGLHRLAGPLPPPARPRGAHRARRAERARRDRALSPRRGVPRPGAARDERLRRGAPGADDGRAGLAAAGGAHRLRDRRGSPEDA